MSPRVCSRRVVCRLCLLQSPVVVLETTTVVVVVVVVLLLGSIVEAGEVGPWTFVEPKEERRPDGVVSGDWGKVRTRVIVRIFVSVKKST